MLAEYAAPTTIASSTPAKGRGTVGMSARLVMPPAKIPSKIRLEYRFIDLIHAGAPGRSLAPVTQIVVGLVQPVFARGIEDIKIDGIFQRPGLVRQVRRDAQPLPRGARRPLVLQPGFQPDLP